MEDLFLWTLLWLSEFSGLLLLRNGPRGLEVSDFSIYAMLVLATSRVAGSFKWKGLLLSRELL